MQRCGDFNAHGLSGCTNIKVLDIWANDDFERQILPAVPPVLCGVTSLTLSRCVGMTSQCVPSSPWLSPTIIK